jgi:hypothetical protein
LMRFFFFWILRTVALSGCLDVKFYSVWSSDICYE